MKQPYTAPTLTVVTFKVEHGFDTSLTGSPLEFDMYSLNDEGDLNQAASYSESTWTW